MQQAALESLKIGRNSEIGKNASTPAAGGSLESFLYAIKSPGTEKQYRNRLHDYFNFLDIQGDNLEEQASKFLAIAVQDHKWAEQCVIRYIMRQKERVKNKDIAGSSLGVHRAAIGLLYECNDISINWKKVDRGLPQSNAVSNDRIPTQDELRKLIDYAADRRIKVIVLIMISSGIRLASWNHLRWKHVEAIRNEKTDQVIAAKIQAYNTKKSRWYTTYCTPEAFEALSQYMQFRKDNGEEITGESWLLRDKFPTATDQHAAIRSMAKNPKKLGETGIKKALNRALWAQGLRDLLPEGERRHPWKMSHSFRKYFSTNCERVMHSSNVLKLADQRGGIQDHYIRFTEDELLQDYLQAVDYLTLYKESKVISELQGDIMQRLMQREKENEILKQIVREVKDYHNVMKGQILDLMQKVRENDEYVRNFQIPEQGNKRRKGKNKDKG